jgi:prolyl oligopeptidase
VQTVVDTHFGVAVSDPYRWMENPNDPDWLPFLQGQNNYTRSTLDALPGRARLLERISANSGDTTVTGSLLPRGDRLFFLRRPAGAEHYKLFVREADGRTRVLIDPTLMSQGGAHVSLDWWRPSYDGAHVVYGLSSAGSEASVLHVMATATGEILPERIEKTDYASPAWLPDNSGF